MQVSPWRWWTARHECVRVLHEVGTGASGYAQAVVPSTGTVERIPLSALADVSARPWTTDELRWRASACRAIAAMAEPGEAAAANANLEPLPHQLVALERALAHNPVRILLADEVGLGKTIEAGLVLTELKSRGRVRRTLIVAPKGVQLQWVAEMAEHFGEEFALIGAGGIPIDAGIDPWAHFDQVVCSVDAIKPMSARRGWTPEQLHQHNALRIDAVLAAGWDLVIFDEAHHVAGSTEDVARHKLARELAAAVPHVLLLSATPHSGKSDAFARLLGLLDDRFVHGLPLSREHVAPLVVRADKRTTTDGHGNALFQARTTTMRTVEYGERTVEARLYDAVTDYVRYGYQRAQAENRPAIGFLVLLMQRLVSSSTAAIRFALQRRHAAILEEGTQLRLFAHGAEEWGDLSGEDQVAALQEALGAAWGDELAEVELLIDLANRAASDGLDAKARALLGLLDETAQTAGDPELKVVVFTEFTQTQAMLLDLFETVGIDAVCVNGAMTIHERSVAQQRFRTDARVLVSTDAGGEGVNLQFAHVVVNYDLPWSPSRIEQRIGRVDRIGQTHPVQAFNMAMEHSIDARVLEVLEEKLRVIADELGADKAGDILNSADRHAPSLYADAVLYPDDLEGAGGQFADRTEDEAAEAATFLELVDTSPADPTIGSRADPSHWIAIAAQARAKVFDIEEAEAGRGDDASILAALPEVTPDEPVPTIEGTRSGLFTLWEVDGVDGTRDVTPLFLGEGFINRPDLAIRLWNELTESVSVGTSPPLSDSDWDQLWTAGWDYGARPDRGSATSPPGLMLRLLVRVQP